jgi:hypothetical protein
MPITADEINKVIAGRTPGQIKADAIRNAPRGQKKIGSPQITNTVPVGESTPTEAARTSSDWYERGIAELEKPADYSSAVASQKGRQSAAERALLLALAAGEANMAPIQRHYLGRASDTGELKMQGATVDQYGNVVEDPVAGRERRGDIFMRRGDVASRREQAEAERVSRNEQRAEDRALRLALAGNRNQQEPMVPVVDESGNTVYMPRSQAAGMKVPQKAAAPKLMPESAVKDLAAMESDAERISELAGTFQTKFGPSLPVPGVGKVERAVGSLVGSDASNWYSRYQSYANEVLKRMSGSAVTQQEMERFNAAMITEQTPASEVPRRLAQQQAAIASARNKLLQAHQQAGYSTGTTAPTPVPGAPGPGQRTDTPSAGGWSIKKVN